MAVTPEMLAAFRLRYLAMATLSDAAATYWLDEAILVVGDNWTEITRSRAQFSYAAHMASATGALPEGALAEGVSSFKSGSFSVALTDAAAARTGFESTVYGREFVALRAQSFNGPRVY